MIYSWVYITKIWTTNGETVRRMIYFHVCFPHLCDLPEGTYKYGWITECNALTSEVYFLVTLYLYLYVYVYIYYIYIYSPMNDDPTWGPNNSPTFPVFFWTVVHKKKHGTWVNYSNSGFMVLLNIVTNTTRRHHLEGSRCEHYKIQVMLSWKPA